MLRKRLLFLSLAAVGLVGCNQHLASPPQPNESVIAAGEIGSRLPDFSVKDLQGLRFPRLTFTAKCCSLIFGPLGANRARKRCQAIRNLRTALAPADWWLSDSSSTP